MCGRIPYEIEGEDVEQSIRVLLPWLLERASAAKKRDTGLSFLLPPLFSLAPSLSCSLSSSLRTLLQIQPQIAKSRSLSPAKNELDGMRTIRMDHSYHIFS